MQFTPLALVSLFSALAIATTTTPGTHFAKRAMGDVTFYDVATDPEHPSACGTTNDPSELVAAVPIAMGKSMCGTSATITRADGRTVTVKIIELCGGCAPTDIDLSRGAFAVVAEEAEGRVQMEVVLEGAAGATGATTLVTSTTSVAGTTSTWTPDSQYNPPAWRL